jgi:peptide/nickel transport system substrate-binding protein
MEKSEAEPSRSPERMPMRSSPRVPRLLAVLLAALLLLAACSSSDDSSESSSDGSVPDAGEPVDGGDLTIARPVDVKQLDPLEAVETATIHSLLMIMETLMVTTPEGTVEPQLAESLEASEDGMTWTVTLKDGIEFSDGTPLTSEDVVFTIQRALDNPDVGFAYMFAPIASVTAVDETTVELVTSEPTSYVPSLLALWVGAVIPADFGEAGSAEAFFEAPVGTGPFTFEEWTPGETMSVNKNDGYWQEGLPHLDSVTWTTVSDDNARITQLQGDQAQVISDAPFSAIEQLSSTPDVTVSSFPSLLQYFLMFNESREPFQDEHVRNAISLALDEESMQEAALFGEGEVACSILPPTIAFYSDEVECIEQDLEAAQAEMDESSVPDGFETTLLVAGTTGTASTGAEIIVENLSEIGIDVEIVRVDDSQLYDTQSTGDYDMIWQGWASDIPDPDQQLTFMLDPEVGGVESYWTYYDDPEVTALLAEARGELDEDARAELYAEVQQLQIEALPQIPLLFMPYLWAQRDSVQGLEVLPTGNYLLQNVWLAE